MTTWDLTDLYAGPDDPAIARDMAAVDELLERFVADYSASVDHLLEALRRYEDILERMETLFNYAQMLWTVDTTDSALMDMVEAWKAQREQRLLFFELYVQTIDEAPAPYRHWLEVRRQQQFYRLSEAEERILAVKAVTGRKAWIRYMDELNAQTRFEFDGEKLTRGELSQKLVSPDRDVRRRAYLARAHAVQRKQHAYTFIYNTVVADKASEDRLRGYPSWMTSFNLTNEISDEAVRVLADSVASRYDLARRIFRLKRDMLGLDDFYVFDISAPLPQSARSYSWDQARTIVLDAFRQFDAGFASIAERFFAENWIHAEPAPNKYPGAYCAFTAPSIHPYVFMTFTGTSADVQTLAHELGHAVHFYLCREQGQLNYMMPLTLSETASTFCETLINNSLLERETDAVARFALLVGYLERISSTLFYQIVMHRFEDAMHRASREEGWLSARRLGDLWMEHYQCMAGDVLTLIEENRMGWNVPHFLMEPGYIYTYAFGELLTLSLYARYRERGADFISDYRQLLQAGGSDWPASLLRPLAIDLNNPSIWQSGLAELEGLVERAESLAGVGSEGR